MAADIIQVSDSSFEAEVLEASLPVLVQLCAPWAGPCEVIAPTVKALADEYPDKLKVVKMNVDGNPEIPQRYNVRGIPNLILFEKGKVCHQIVGAVPKRKLVEAIENVINIKGQDAKKMACNGMDIPPQSGSEGPTSK